MPINKGLGGFCFLKSVKDEIILKKNEEKKNEFTHLSFLDIFKSLLIIFFQG